MAAFGCKKPYSGGISGLKEIEQQQKLKESMRLRLKVSSDEEESEAGEESASTNDTQVSVAQHSEVGVTEAKYVRELTTYKAPAGEGVPPHRNPKIPKIPRRKIRQLRKGSQLRIRRHQFRRRKIRRRRMLQILRTRQLKLKLRILRLRFQSRLSPRHLRCQLSHL